MCCKKLSDLDKEASRFVNTLVPHSDKATLVTLSGDLGAGKTAFVKAIAKTFGITELVTSPTFVLEKIYKIPSTGEDCENTKAFSCLVHIDTYRLDNGSDLETLGFDELMQNSKNLVLLEWPEQVKEALPEVDIHITIEILSDESRKIIYA